MTNTKQDAERQMIDWNLVTELFLRRYPPPISCLVCGQKGELAICHAPSGAWVCMKCRDAVQARASQEPRPQQAWCSIHGGLRPVGTPCMYCEPRPAGGELLQRAEQFVADWDDKNQYHLITWKIVAQITAAFAASERGQECNCGPNVAGQPLIVKTLCSVCGGEVHE